MCPCSATNISLPGVHLLDVMEVMPSGSASTFACFESMHSKCRQLVRAAQFNHRTIVLVGIDYGYLNIVIVYFRALQREEYTLFHLVQGCWALLAAAFGCHICRYGEAPESPRKNRLLWTVVRVAPLKKMPCVCVFSATLSARTPSVGFAVYVCGRFCSAETAAKQQRQRWGGGKRALFGVFHSKVALCVLAAAGRIAQLSCASTRNLRNDLFAVAFSLRASDSCMYKRRHFLEGLLFSHSIRRTRLFVACCLMSAVPRLSLLERFSSPSDALTWLMLLGVAFVRISVSLSLLLSCGASLNGRPLW